MPKFFFSYLPIHHSTGVVPLICQYTPPPGPLDDGFYKIDFVPDPSLFADAVGGANSPVEALNPKVQKPTTVIDYGLNQGLSI